MICFTIGAFREFYRIFREFFRVVLDIECVLSCRVRFCGVFILRITVTVTRSFGPAIGMLNRFYFNFRRIKLCEGVKIRVIRYK